MASTSFLRFFFCIVLIFQMVHGEHQFPSGFSFGVATSAYQIEGAWNVSGKGENVWDWWTHNEPYRIVDRSNGDVACDSYHKYKEDVQLLKSLGVRFYRFSLSWSRILPNGLDNEINQDGINYYNSLLDELLNHGIRPFVTLYHWDHPEILEEMGGWTNDEMSDWFADYARVVFRELGPKIPFFVTINEPSVFCSEGYASNIKAPGKDLHSVGMYLCMHNVLKAHAKAYHLYRDEFHDQQNGYIGMVTPCAGAFPKNPNDTDAADTYFQFTCGWLDHPIYSTTGDYPEIMKSRIAENSLAQGYSRSMLPEFSPEWIQYIKGTYDFYALNHYTSVIVETMPHEPGTVWYNEAGVKVSQDPTWPKSASEWLRVVPEGFQQVLQKIKSEYNNPPVYVTENGYSDYGDKNDDDRINYLSSYLRSMLNAIYDDGCNVYGYAAWSLLDNYEWERGFKERFGIVYVDTTSADRARSPKSSFYWLKNVIQSGSLPPASISNNDIRVTMT